MRAVIQRVSHARVVVDGQVTGEIGPGLVVLLGVGKGDGPDAASYLAEKISRLRVFGDADGKMNRSLLENGGAALVISQFTLYGDVRRGRRPGFDDAAPPASAKQLYEAFVRCLRQTGVRVETGVFQARMEVELVNEGPVTLLLDSNKLF
jgi:D-tyrosyl-tRNA(Tyr) deacylase